VELEARSTPPSGLQASKNTDSCPTFTQATPPNIVPVKTTTGRRVARPQFCQVPSAPPNHALPFSVERYLNEAPQDGGPTYGLAHADLESRLGAIARALCDPELNVQGVGNT